jgi:hypothetical protein
MAGSWWIAPALHWTGLYVRLCRLPRVVCSVLVPATPEPLITCNAKDSTEFRERDLGGAWITRKSSPARCSSPKTLYEVRWTSPAGQEIEVIQIHLAIGVFRAALEETYPSKANTVKVIDFFGRDEALKARPLLRSRYGAHLCQARADMLTARTRGNTRRGVGVTPTEFRSALQLVEKRTSKLRESGLVEKERDEFDGTMRKKRSPKSTGHLLRRWLFRR